MHFDIIDYETSCIEIIGELVCPLPGGSLYADCMPRGVPIVRILIDLLLPILIVELVCCRNRQIPIGNTTLDGGIDIHVASADENIAISKNTGAQRVVLSASVIQRRTANAENALGFSVVALDVITIVNLHVHSARVDSAIGVDITVLAGYGHIASGIVNVSGQRGIRCRILRYGSGFAIFFLFHANITGRLEIVQNGNRRISASFAVPSGDSEIHGLRRILIRLCYGSLHVAFQFHIIVVDGAALAGALSAQPSYYLHISHFEIIRRYIGDGDLRITASSQGATAGNIVPFEEDIPQLRGDVANLYVTGHLGIILAVEEVICAVRQIAISVHGSDRTVAIDRNDCISILVEEFTTRLCAACVKEIVRSLNLRFQICLIRGTPILRCIDFLDLVRERFHIAAEILRGIGADFGLVSAVIRFRCLAISRRLFIHYPLRRGISLTRFLAQFQFLFVSSLGAIICRLCLSVVFDDLFFSMVAICHICLYGCTGSSSFRLYCLFRCF